MINKNCKLGLDIGVTSVGYAVLSQDGDVLESGVRLFQERTAKENAARREARHQRRGIRRKHHRLERIDRLFHSAGLCDKNFKYTCNKNVNPYMLRAKGLTEQLTKEELAIALRHIAKRRGLQTFSTEISEKDLERMEEEDKKNSSKMALEAVRQELDKGKYVCEVQLDMLNNNGSVRGTDNKFFTVDYVKEANAILETQKQYYPDIITNDFINKYIELVETRREYFEGPGTNGNAAPCYGAGSTSPYGWKNTEEWLLNLQGKCTYCEGERRIVKCSPTLELFNVLNDLNNITINGVHLTKKQKVFLIEEVFKKTATAPSSEKIVKKLGYDEDSILTGARTNAKGEPTFTGMVGYHLISKCSKETGETIDLNDFDLLDNIANVMNIYQEPESIESHLINDLHCDKNFANKIANVKDNKFKGTASLSKKAINMVLNDMLNTDHNSSFLFNAKGMSPVTKVFNFKNGRINSNIFEQTYASPVVKRAVKQTIIVWDQLYKKYEFESVTIEMAKEKNSEEEKRYIQKLQRKNAKINEEVNKLLGSKVSFANNKLRQKIRLYIEQEGRDIYTQKPVDLELLISNEYAYEIDHIVPISISYRDSLDNKVLTAAKNNQNKSQRTPYEYMNAKDFKKMEAFAISLYGKGKTFENKNKLANLLFKGNIDKYEIQKEFIERNLVDTRYATKEVAAMFNAYFKYMNMPTKVYTVNGSFTHVLRKMWGISKDRDLDNSHHAVDAAIIALAPSVFNSNNSFRMHYAKENNDNIKGLSCETADDKRFKSSVYYYSYIAKKFLTMNIEYQYDIDKKINRQLSDQTLYSTRIDVDKKGNPIEYKISKIKNIYTESPAKLRKLFENPDKLLIYKHDIESYKILKEIFNKCYVDDKTNPFAEYCNEYGYIKKYSKKGNGPVIKGLKYISGVINSEPLDVSEKQGVTYKNKRVVITGHKVHHVEVYSDGDTQKFIVVKYLHYKNGCFNEKTKNELLYKAKIDSSFKFIKSLYSGSEFECDGKKYTFKGYHARQSIYCTEKGKNELLDLTIGKKHQIF